MGLKSTVKFLVFVSILFAPCMGLKSTKSIKAILTSSFAPCMGLKRLGEAVAI